MSLFHRFCDQLEMRNGVPGPATGWGVQNALAAWAKFWKREYFFYSTQFLFRLVWEREPCSDDLQSAQLLMSSM